MVQQTSEDDRMLEVLNIRQSLGQEDSSDRKGEGATSDRALTSSSSANMKGPVLTICLVSMKLLT